MQSERILVVVAHADDETLMAGGTIAKHVNAGDAVHVLVLADGVTSRGDSDVRERETQAWAACGRLGVQGLFFNNAPDNKLDAVSLLSLVKTIESHVENARPTIVITHWRGDVNVDHRITHDAVLAACRPQPSCSVRTLLFGECPSSTEWNPNGNFNPNYFVDIHQTMEAKIAAMREYKTELRDSPHPRSIEAIRALARWRGASVGVLAAEAFMCGRIIA